jgi:hypothetical protein
MSYTFRSMNADGILNGIELTPERAFDLAAGDVIACFRRDERILVSPDGRTIRRQSVIPQRLGQAA